MVVQMMVFTWCGSIICGTRKCELLHPIGGRTDWEAKRSSQAEKRENGCDYNY
jgi:hypothetical protein